MGEGSEAVRLQVKDLRPTQMTVGFREVATKQEELECEAKDDRQGYLKAHLVPVVLGPAGQPHIVDHHHLVRALWQAGIHHAWCHTVGDLTKLDEQEFWKHMQAREWVYPYDEQNKRRPYADIPDHVEALRDDPFRSLAGFVRGLGGFVKDGATPFVEFAWANFFRERIALPPGDGPFRKALQEALKLSHTPAAKGLPGYVKPAATAAKLG